MREDGTCPKCKGRKIWWIEKVHVNSDVLGGRELHLLEERSMSISPREEKGVLFGSKTIDRERVTRGSLDAYVCARCGFTEWYTRGLEDLDPSPRDGVHLLDADAGSRGAYR